MIRRPGGCCTCTAWAATASRCCYGSWLPGAVCGWPRRSGARRGGCLQRSFRQSWALPRRPGRCRWRGSILGPVRPGRTGPRSVSRRCSWSSSNWPGITSRHRRLVWMLGPHEAPFGEAVADPHALVHADYLMRDEWLRSLLGHLRLQEGVVGVVAGRTRPLWNSASVAAIPDEFVEAWHVGY